MSYEVVESKFVATEEQGEVSSLLIRPDGAQWMLVLGHGASTNMRHTTLQTIAERLADVGIATFRYNFLIQNGAAVEIQTPSVKRLFVQRSQRRTQRRAICQFSSVGTPLADGCRQWLRRRHR